MGVLTRIWYVLLFILIVSLLLYDNVYTRYKAENGFTLKKYLENPQEYGGYKGQRFGKVINMSHNHFYFNVGDSHIKVVGSGIKKPVYGETLVFINHKKDGTMELIDYHNYNYNHLLYLVSFFALIIFIVVFFKEWKITLKGGNLFGNKYF